mgnify:CR=1 FL=1
MATTIAHNSHRWYETQTGRYTAPDPVQVQEAGGSNPLGHVYAYVDSQPLRMVDRLGLLGTSLCGVNEHSAVFGAAMAILRAFRETPSCLGCDSLRDQVKQVLYRANVTCVAKDEQSGIPGAHSGVCAWAGTPTKEETGSDITFFAQVFDEGPNPPCGCIGGTLLHEALHLSGVDGNSAGDKAKGCLPCHKFGSH